MRISDWSSDVCSSDLIDQPFKWYIGQFYDLRGAFGIQNDMNQLLPALVMPDMHEFKDALARGLDVDLNPVAGLKVQELGREDIEITVESDFSPFKCIKVAEIGRASCRERECQYV